MRRKQQTPTMATAILVLAAIGYLAQTNTQVIHVRHRRHRKPPTIPLAFIAAAMTGLATGGLKARSGWGWD